MPVVLMMSNRLKQFGRKIRRNIGKRKFESIFFLILLLAVAVSFGSQYIDITLVTPTKVDPVSITLTPTITGTATVSLPPLADPTPTPTPIQTYTSTVTNTVTNIGTHINPTEFPVATLNESVMLKSGPDENKYNDIYIYKAGTSLVVEGISTDEEWFVVKLEQYQNNGLGWARKMYFTYDFDPGTLPQFKDPPPANPEITIPTTEEAPIDDPTPTFTSTPTPPIP